jgi:long-chain fatty acid transport protein
MLTGFFQTSVYFSACVPERFICAPEQPDYDSYARLRVGPIFAPSGTIGAILLPSDIVRIGASFHLPFWVNAHATQDVRLPSAAVFQNASVEGKDATVKFRLPWTARAGVELRPTDDIRMEAGVGYEAWSMHDQIHVSSDEIALINVAGFPQRYRIAPVDIERGFQDSYSARVGGELGFPVGSYRLVARTGVTYEKSAVPKEYLSAASIDLDKVVFAVGGSLHIGKWRFDGVVAHVLATSAVVGVDEQRVEQVNPVMANPSANPNYINAGSYSASANVLGLGLAYQFDSPDEPPTRPTAEPEPTPKTTPKAAEPAPAAAPPEGEDAFEKAFEEQTGDDASKSSEKKKKKKQGTK